MPLLTHRETIRQYWEESKSNYTGLTFEEFELICNSPFLFLRMTIRAKSKNFVIFTYLGKFRSMPWIVRDQIKKYIRGKEKGVMPEEDFNIKMEEALRYQKEVNDYYEEFPEELDEDCEEGT